MRAFEVYINGKNVCTAGVPEASGTAQGNLLLRLLTFSEGGAVIAVNAVEAATHERLDWPLTQVTLGDEITVRFVETAEADPPEARRPPRPPIVRPPELAPELPAHCEELLKSWRRSDGEPLPKAEP